MAAMQLARRQGSTTEAVLLQPGMGFFFGFEEIHYHIYIFVSLGFLVVQKQDLSHHFYVSVRPCFASRVL